MCSKKLAKIDKLTSSRCPFNGSGVPFTKTSVIGVRVLILTPWLFRAPRNGGQLRAQGIVETYIAAGHEVIKAGLYVADDDTISQASPTDLPLKQDAVTAYEALSPVKKRSEMAWWEAVAAAPQSFRSFADAVSDARPDLLQFEEIALWPIVRRLKLEGFLRNVRIAHSSYNFETEAWRHRSTVGSAVTEETLRDISVVEQEIAAHCDLIFTVSEGDAREFRKLGAAKVIVAPNGMARPVRRSLIMDSYISRRTSFGVFVSSAHPPNAHGFVDLASGLSEHPIRSGDILICGKVGDLVRSSPNYRKAKRIIERSRFLGWVENDALSTVYDEARVVILPKLYGGGSNLKTAEALLSGRPIVATRLAFEGFETFISLPEIVIADEADHFWGAVGSYLTREWKAVDRPASALSCLFWDNCLVPMVNATEKECSSISNETPPRNCPVLC